MNSANAYYRERSRALALEVVRLFSSGQNYQPAMAVMSKQLIRCACSAAANYRAMCLARSSAEYFSKLCIVVEESDETVFWCEMLSDSGLGDPTALAPIIDEARQLAKVFTSYRAKLKTPKHTRATEDPDE